MKEKQLNKSKRIYEIGLKNLDCFKEKMKGNGFRRIEIETYLVKDYLILNR